MSNSFMLKRMMQKIMNKLTGKKTLADHVSSITKMIGALDVFANKSFAEAGRLKTEANKLEAKRDEVMAAAQQAEEISRNFARLLKA